MKHLSNLKQIFLVVMSMFLFGYVHSQIPAPVAYFPMYGNGTDTVIQELVSHNDAILRDYDPGEFSFTEEGKVGTAAQFDSDSGFVTTPAIDYMTGGSFSICFWIEMDTTGLNGNQLSPFLTGDVNEPNSVWFRFRQEGDYVRFYVYDKDGIARQLQVNLSVSYPDFYSKKWMFIAATNNPDSSAFYIDGAYTGKKSTTLISGFDEAVPSVFGSDYGYSAYHGKMDELRLYNYALDASQIQQIYEITTHAELQTKQYKLSHYPNPFADGTTISYDLQKAGNVSLEIFNMNGQLVKTLVNNEYQQLSTYERSWDCRNESGQLQPAGLYFYRLSVDNEAVGVGKMTLIK